MNNELEQIKLREESLKKILIEAKSCIDKAEILNDSNEKRLNEITEKLISKGFNANNLKQEIINNIEECNFNLNSIYNSISFKMLSYYNKLDISICSQYEELDKMITNINYDIYNNIESKIEILKKKLIIVQTGLEQSKTVRDTALGKEEHLRLRKLEIENKILDKGIEPKNIENEILNKKNELNLLQNEIYENLKDIIEVFKTQNIISNESLVEWEKIKSSLF